MAGQDQESDKCEKQRETRPPVLRLMAHIPGLTPSRFKSIESLYLDHPAGNPVTRFVAQMVEWEPCHYAISLLNGDQSILDKEQTAGNPGAGLAIQPGFKAGMSVSSVPT